VPPSTNVNLYKKDVVSCCNHHIEHSSSFPSCSHIHLLSDICCQYVIYSTSIVSLAFPFPFSFVVLSSLRCLPFFFSFCFSFYFHSIMFPSSVIDTCVSLPCVGVHGLLHCTCSLSIFSENVILWDTACSDHIHVISQHSKVARRLFSCVVYCPFCRYLSPFVFRCVFCGVAFESFVLVVVLLSFRVVA